MSQPEPLTEQQLDEIEARAAHLHEYGDPTDTRTAGWEELAGTDVPALLAEIRRLAAALTEMTHCRDNALRALYRDDVETDIDLEETIGAPFYGPGWDWDDDGDMGRVVREAVAAIRPAFGKLTQERDRLRTDAAAELLPVWEAVYEPGNVSDYLIGYMNDQDAATGAAEAWMRSQSEVTGRLEWVPWGDVTPMPDGYDRWFELVQRHDDGIDTGTGITVRRRAETAQETSQEAVDPSACRWCHVPEREHMQRWKSPVGWHQWEQPTQEQIKERMQARRAGRANARLLDCGWCYEEQGEEVHPHPECPIGAVVSVGHAVPAPATAPLAASQPSEAPVEGQAAARAATGRVGDSRRTLTPNEYDAAWHAVEGAAGEEGADPGTVLHAVLDRLGIDWQDAARTV